MVAELRSVPGGDVVGLHLLKLPEQLLESFDVSGGDSLSDYDEAVGLPVLKVVFGEDTTRQFFLDGAKRFPQDGRGEFVVAGLAHFWFLFENCGIAHNCLRGPFGHRRTICI